MAAAAATARMSHAWRRVCREANAQLVRELTVGGGAERAYGAGRQSP